MKYIKLGRGNHCRNNDRSLVLRMKFGIIMLKEIQKGKRIINIDETWLGSSNYRRSEWCTANASSVINEHLVRPRISLITAIDTEGRSYISLS